MNEEIEICIYVPNTHSLCKIETVFMVLKCCRVLFFGCYFSGFACVAAAIQVELAKWTTKVQFQATFTQKCPNWKLQSLN